MSLWQPEEQGYRFVSALPCLCPQGNWDKGLESRGLPSQTGEWHLQAQGGKWGFSCQEFGFNIFSSSLVWSKGAQFCPGRKSSPLRMCRQHRCVLAAAPIPSSLHPT